MVEPPATEFYTYIIISAPLPDKMAAAVRMGRGRGIYIYNKMASASERLKYECSYVCSG